MAAFSLIELIFVLGIAATLGGIASAHAAWAIDTARIDGAARYLASRLQEARMEAIAHGDRTAVRVVPSGSDYTMTSYTDGNGDGVLTRDIDSGVDWEFRPPESLGERFPGVRFGALPGLPAPDSGGTPPGSDPVRLGSSNGVTFTPAGTATAGSLYLLGADGQQLVVRIFGETGRTRVLRFNAASRQWTVAW